MKIKLLKFEKKYPTVTVLDGKEEEYSWMESAVNDKLTYVIRFSKSAVKDGYEFMACVNADLMGKYPTMDNATTACQAHFEKLFLKLCEQYLEFD